MALTITKPIADGLYVLKQNASTNILIEWTHSNGNNVDIEYSVNGGAYQSIESDYTPVLVVDKYQYTWTPSNSEITAIVGAASAGVEVTIKVVEHGTANADESDGIWMRTPSLAELLPTTLEASSMDPIPRKSVINLVWTWIADNTDPACEDTNDLQIFVRRDDGSYGTAIETAYSRNYTHYHLNLFDKDETAALVAGLTEPTKFWVKIQSANAEPNKVTNANFIETSFYVANEPDGTGYVWAEDFLRYKHYPSRKDFMARLAAEKAVFVDETVVIGQHEAGNGVKILQRDRLGRLSESDPEDLSKAWNLVWVIEETELPTPDVPRQLEGVIDFINDSYTVVTSRNLGNFYGQLRRLEIAHNWGLNTTRNYSKSSYHIEFQEMLLDDGDLAAPSHLSLPTYETSSSDVISVYMNVKGVDLTSDLAKDTFAETQFVNHDDFINVNGSLYISRYVYRYKITEVLKPAE